MSLKNIDVIAIACKFVRSKTITAKTNTSMLQSNKKDFTGQKIAIGIDVHLRTWSVTVLTASGLIRTHSQKASAKELFEHLKSIILTAHIMPLTKQAFQAFLLIMP